MKKIVRLIKKWLLLFVGIILGFTFLLIGPIAINYVFVTETIGWDINLTFTAGEMLQYFGAVLGGIVTCFAIITTIHINNKNRKQDWRRQQFERTYAIYHKLPEILAKLEIAAIHVQYSVSLPEDKLIETLDSMKESESILREQHFTNDVYYSKNIEPLLRKIIFASAECQENVERYLQDIKSKGVDLNIAYSAMESAFIELRELIKSAKSEIMAETSQLISVYDGDE